jgi:hypothetical protein
MSRRTLTWAAIAAFVLGVALMIPFEYLLTRVLGVAALFAWIVLGTFAIAHPDSLGESGGE